eukprot:2868473-Pyramimonas_sp.AAC.1
MHVGKHVRSPTDLVHLQVSVRRAQIRICVGLRGRSLVGRSRSPGAFRGFALACRRRRVAGPNGGS